MVREVRERGFPASKERVERLMRENGIRARHKRRYKATTDSRHELPVTANLLARNFAPTAPDQAWSADLTYVWTDEGWLYLAVVQNLFNRRDYAPTISFFNSLKNERVHGTRYATRDAAIADLFAYIEVFYNQSRPHSTLGYKSPKQSLSDWITTQHERKTAA